jgi:alpha-beta hydrolase superfamily lysophospholipase
VPKSDIKTFIASDGYPIRFRHWSPEGVPRGYVVAIHGIQSHSGWYTYSSRLLCAAGYEVFYLDRRGSGLNEQDRGDVTHLERLLYDVIQFLAQVGAQRDKSAPEAPVILSSVSWGGKLAVSVAAKRPQLIDGMALLYPGICARIHVNWIQNIQLKLADLFRVRSKRVRIPLDDPALFTTSSEWQEFIQHDPLALKDVTTSFLLANRELDRLAYQAPEFVVCPTLLLLAGKDRIIDNDRTKRYFDRLQNKANRTIEYPESAHTLEFEPDRDVFINDLIEWMQLIDHEIE